MAKPISVAIIKILKHLYSQKNKNGRLRLHILSLPLGIMNGMGVFHTSPPTKKEKKKKNERKNEEYSEPAPCMLPRLR